MSVDQDISNACRGQMAGIPAVPMAEKKPVPLDFDAAIFRQHREVQEFLVAVPVAVSPHGNDFILPAVEPGRRLFAGAGTVQRALPATEKNIAEQHQFIWSQFLDSLLEQSQAVR